MSDMTRSKVDEVVYGSRSEEVPLETKRLAEPHIKLPIRLSSRGLDDDRVIGASQAISIDSFGPDADDNSPSGSWQHVPTPDAAAPDKTNTQKAIRKPQIFELRPTYSDFYAAVKRGDTSSITTMLNSGANIERRDDEGATALLIAIYAQKIDTITLLLEKGANVHYPVMDSPPIYHAVMQGPRAIEIIVLLVAHGADLNVTAGPTRLNPLHWAAAKGMLHAASFLISQGLDMEKRCLRGKTPLILAAEKGHTNVVKLLIARGVDCHARSESGATALTWAASNGHLETVEYLLWEGARVEDCDEDGTSKSKSVIEMLRTVTDCSSRVSYCQYIRPSGSSQATAEVRRGCQHAEHQAEGLYSCHGSGQRRAYRSAPSSNFLWR
jgi:ankyrin repeat protein